MPISHGPSAPLRPAKKISHAATQLPTAASHHQLKSCQWFQSNAIHEDEWTEYVDEATDKPCYDNAASFATRWDKSPAVSADVAKHSPEVTGCFQLY
jgi:hypothetical protein